MSDLVFAGGTESLSHRPRLSPRRGVVSRLRGPSIRAKAPDLPKSTVVFKPVGGLERGLTDPIVQLNMGQTAELVAHLFRISRQQADSYAAESQKRLARAQAEGWLNDEIEPAFARDGTLYDHDDGVRPDSSVESLAKLKPRRTPVGAGSPRAPVADRPDGATWVISHRSTPSKVQGSARPSSSTANGRRSIPPSWDLARYCAQRQSEAASTGSRRYRFVGIE